MANESESGAQYGKFDDRTLASEKQTKHAQASSAKVATAAGRADAQFSAET
jgi:hypothetical protein